MRPRLGHLAAVIILASVLVSVTASPVAAVTYSWTRIFAEPESVDWYRPIPALGCPIHTKTWPAITLPFCQPNDSSQVLHQGFDLPGDSKTTVYAANPGWITAVDLASGTVVQSVDTNGDGQPENLKIEYRHLVTNSSMAYVGRQLTTRSKLGTMGRDPADNDYKLHVSVMAYDDYAARDCYIRPDKFYMAAVDWDTGYDTSFIKAVYRDFNWHQIQLIAYTLDVQGNHVAPATVEIYHKRPSESTWWLSQMQSLGGNQYLFDFLDCKDSYNNRIYQDGDVVQCVARATMGGQPPQNGYLWEFSPCCAELPDPDVNHWAGHGYRYWHYTLPQVTLTRPKPIAGKTETVYGLWPIAFELSDSINQIEKVEIIRTLTNPTYSGTKTLTIAVPARRYQYHWNTREFVRENETYGQDGTCVITINVYEPGRVTPIATDSVTVEVENRDGQSDPTLIMEPSFDSDAPLDIGWPDLYSPCATIEDIGGVPTKVAEYPGVTSKCLQPRSVSPGFSNPHRGVDFDKEVGDEVYPPWRAYVEAWRDAEDPSVNKWLLLRLDFSPGGRTYCVFQHLSEIIPSIKVQGLQVGPADIVAEVGYSGLGDPLARHLHYQILTIPEGIDPAQWFSWALTNPLYPYYDDLAFDPTHWMAGHDLDFICDVSASSSGVVATAYGMEHGVDRESLEVADPAGDFDPTRVYLYYRYLDPATGEDLWRSTPMTLEALGANEWRYTCAWPSDTVGKGEIQYLIRARRIGEDPNETVSDSYYNFCFFPPSPYRPEPWPDLTDGVPALDGYPYGFKTYVPEG